MYGLTGMGRMANFFTPLLLLFIGYALYSTSLPKEWGKQEYAFQWQSLTLVIATNIAAVIDLPNFFRYARTQKDGVVSTIILFAIPTPLIEGIGVYLAYSLPNLSLMDALQSQNGLLGLWSALFLLLGGWITNNANLFSATVSSEKLLPHIAEKKRTFILGAIGTIFTCLHPSEYLEAVVNAMGIAVSSMGGVIIPASFLSISAKKGLLSYPICWTCGAIVGYFTLFTGFSLSGIALLDAFITAGLLTSLKKFMERKVYVSNE
jgi:purine-cytosine permease-like protein